jgi:hypothetical protein
MSHPGYPRHVLWEPEDDIVVATQLKGACTTRTVRAQGAARHRREWSAAPGAPSTSSPPFERDWSGIAKGLASAGVAVAVGYVAGLSA